MEGPSTSNSISGRTFSCGTPNFELSKSRQDTQNVDLHSKSSFDYILINADESPWPSLSAPASELISGCLSFKAHLNLMYFLKLQKASNSGGLL